MSDRPEIDLSRIQTYDLKERKSKVNLDSGAKPWRPGGDFRDFLASLPRELAADDLRAVVQALVRAARGSRPVILGMGAHGIKVGLSPIIIDLIQKGLLSGVALNGAGVIHDFELALVGRTSEDVEEELKTGAFGMARQTGEQISRGHPKRRFPGAGHTAKQWACG